MASCCKIYKEILVYTIGEEFFDVSNDYYLHKIQFFKRKVKVNFALEQATKYQKGNRSIALIFLCPRL
jgi:hypothetical protein